MDSFRCISVTGWFLSVVWLPALLLIMPINQQLANARVKIYNFSFVGVFVTRQWKTILVVTALTSAVMLPFIGRNKLNDMFLNFFSDSLPVKKSTVFTVTNLTGIYSIEYSLGADGPDGITQTGYLKKVDQFLTGFTNSLKSFRSIPSSM